MKRCCLFAALVWFVAFGGVCSAFDTVKTDQRNITARVVNVDSKSVKFKKISGDSLTKDIPVNQIKMIHFDGEPRNLYKAKNYVLSGHYAEALAALERIDLERVRKNHSRPEIRQDIDFYKALCSTKLALGGSLKIVDAGKLMKAFADDNPNSYHYFEAAEAVGDLLVAFRQYPQAEEYYARLQSAPWTDYQMRGGVAVGWARLDQGKTEQAAKVFDKVIETKAEGDAAERQRMFARIGKAGTLVALKKLDEAIKLVEEVVKKTGPEDAMLLARAYNVLGGAERQAGRDKAARLAYLRVDVLYSAQPNAHAEALANLVELWEQVHQTERANRAKQILLDRYPDSTWAEKMKK